MEINILESDGRRLLVARLRGEERLKTGPVNAPPIIRAVPRPPDELVVDPTWHTGAALQ